MDNSENQKIEIRFQLVFLHDEVSNINIFNDDNHSINDNYQEEIQKYNDKIKTDCKEIFYELLKYEDNEPEITIIVSYKKGSYELIFDVSIIITTIALSNFFTGFFEGIIDTDFHEMGKKCAEQLKMLLSETYFKGNDETIRKYLNNNKKIAEKISQMNENIRANRLVTLDNIIIKNDAVIQFDEMDPPKP